MTEPIHQNEMSAVTTGHGQSVNVVIGSDALRPFAWFAGTVLSIGLLVSIISLTISIYSNSILSTKADRLVDETSRVKTEAREMSYWAERAEVAADKYGLQLPKPPKSVQFSKE